MFSFLILMLASVCTFVCSEEYEVPQDVDIGEIIKNDRLMRNYLDCVLEKGKCTPEGDKLKKIIPEALENECAKCNDKQREGIKTVLHHLIEKKPEWWQELQVKFDPKGAYKQKYIQYLKNEELAY